VKRASPAYLQGRRFVDQWRVLLLNFGPRGDAERLCGLVLCELARANALRHVVVTPTHTLLAGVLRISLRSVSRRLAVLRRDGWLDYYGDRAHSGRAATYRLEVPATITPEQLEAAHEFKPGMWKELRTARHEAEKPAPFW